MNLANLLSFSRVPFLFVIVILLHTRPQTMGATLAFVLFIIAALTDYLDGYVARKYKMVTDLGKFMDALTDKVLTIGLFVTFLSMGILPAWTLLLVLFILTREFLITGLRLVAVREGIVLAAEKSGKIKTVFQMVSIIALLLSNMMLMDFQGHLPEPYFSFVYEYLGIGMFTVSAALTIYSGSLYMIKYGALFVQARTQEEEGDQDEA